MMLDQGLVDRLLGLVAAQDRSNVRTVVAPFTGGPLVDLPLSVESDLDAAMLPSERHDPDLARCGRVGANALRRGLAIATDRWLPAWSGRLTPHVLRHYCASSLYGEGMDLKALQELLGHQWLSTTSGYIHVRSDHVEKAWKTANQRVAARFGEGG